MTSDSADRPSRETRLLLLVVVVAIGVLVLLARFRYPSTSLTSVTPSPGALAGLAARASFDDMAGVLTALLNRLSASALAVQLEPVPVADPVPSADPAAVTPPVIVAPRRSVAAMRMRGDLALVYTDPGTRPALPADLVGPVEIVGTDPGRAISLLRVAAFDTGGPAGIQDSFGGFSYVAVVEAMPGGTTIRPRFIGRVDPVADARWSRPLLGVGEPNDLPVGAWLFTIDGRLLGLVVAHGGGSAIAPPSALDALVTELLGAGSGL